MAQQTITQTFDDFTGEPGAQRHEFGLDGVGYEIDLSDENFKQLYDILTQYIGKARRLGRTRSAASGSTVITRRVPKAPQINNRLVRTWWRVQFDEGADLPSPSERGRVPEVVLAAFRAANPDEDGAAGRSKHPGIDEVISVYNQVGTIRGVADHFDVSYPTAANWVKALPA